MQQPDLVLLGLTRTSRMVVVPNFSKAIMEINVKGYLKYLDIVVML
jgi:hypothetical protein